MSTTATRELGSCPVGADVCREAHAEVVRLQTALDDLVDEWEDIGRGDSPPLIRAAFLSAAGQVRDVLWPEEGA